MTVSPRQAVAIAALAAGALASAQPCEWSPLGRGLNPGSTAASVSAIETFDDGSGEALYVGGDFTVADRTIVYNVARWDGEAWSAMGPGFPDGLVYDFAVFDDGRGGGPALYAGGSFETSGGKPVRCVARWNGASWSEVGGGIVGARFGKPKVYALAVYDDGSGSALYAGGEFWEAGGIAGTSFIARWDGESWSSVGGGMSSYVYGLGVFDDGIGPALYAGGLFTAAGGVPADRIARWDGRSWSEVGGGMDKGVGRFVVFDDGRGPAVFVGGSFSVAGGLPASGIARWDGESWSGVGGGTNKSAAALAVFDDGRGPALYTAGAFTMAGDTPVSGVARWDGKEWSGLGSGLGGKESPSAGALGVFDDGNGPALYAAGNFLAAGGVPVNHIARWRCEHPRCPADCDASGALDFLDFLCFQNLFAAADPLADCDGSTTLDFFDFLCFHNAFAAGCP